MYTGAEVAFVCDLRPTLLKGYEPSLGYVPRYVEICAASFDWSEGACPERATREPDGANEATAEVPNGPPLGSGSSRWSPWRHRAWSTLRHRRGPSCLLPFPRSSRTSLAFSSASGASWAAPLRASDGSVASSFSSSCSRCWSAPMERSARWLRSFRPRSPGHRRQRNSRR